MAKYTFSIGDKTIRGARETDPIRAKALAVRLASERAETITVLCDGLAVKLVGPPGASVGGDCCLYVGRRRMRAGLAIAEAECEARKLARRHGATVLITSLHGEALVTVRP